MTSLHLNIRSGTVYDVCHLGIDFIIREVDHRPLLSEHVSLSSRRITQIGQIDTESILRIHGKVREISEWTSDSD